MKAFALALGIGAVAGSRSMLAPALVMNARRGLSGSAAGGPHPGRGGAAAWVMAAAAAGEMVADKTPGIPSRTETLPLSGRIASGAAAAASLAAPGRRLQAAAGGAAGALVGTFALYHLRRLITRRLGLPDAAAGLAEDALAVGAGLMLMRSGTERLRRTAGRERRGGFPRSRPRTRHAAR